MVKLRMNPVQMISYVNIHSVSDLPNRIGRAQLMIHTVQYLLIGIMSFDSLNVICNFAE